MTPDLLVVLGVVAVGSAAVVLVVAGWALAWLGEYHRRLDAIDHARELRQLAQDYEARLIRAEGEAFLARAELNEALQREART